MKNETICECGHLKEFHVCDARDHVDGCDCKHAGWCGEDCACTAFTAAKSLRDEMFESCDSVGLNYKYNHCTIDHSVQKWGVWDADDNLIEGSHGHSTPEDAFAWLKEHLKEKTK